MKYDGYDIPRFRLVDFHGFDFMEMLNAQFKKHEIIGNLIVEEINKSTRAANRRHTISTVSVFVICAIILFWSILV